jgi:hypothetical protein
MTTVKVLSWNIERRGDDKPRNKLAVKEILKHDPDVVFVQEDAYINLDGYARCQSDDELKSSTLFVNESRFDLIEYKTVLSHANKSYPNRPTVIATIRCKESNTLLVVGSAWVGHNIERKHWKDYETRLGLENNVVTIIGGDFNEIYSRGVRKLGMMKCLAPTVPTCCREKDSTIEHRFIADIFFTNVSGSVQVLKSDELDLISDHYAILGHFQINGPRNHRGGGPESSTVNHETIDGLMKQVTERLSTEIPDGGVTFLNGVFYQKMKAYNRNIFYDLFSTQIFEEIPQKNYFGFTKRKVPLPALNRTLRSRLFRSPP